MEYYAISLPCRVLQKVNKLSGIRFNTHPALFIQGCGPGLQITVANLPNELTKRIYLAKQ